MAEVAALGGYLAARFGMPDLRSYATRSRGRDFLMVTELVSDGPMLDPTPSIGAEDAFLVGLQIASSDHELWYDGRPLPSPRFAPGETAFYDLRRDPAVFVRGAFHSLQFHLPSAVLSEMADGRAVDDLRAAAGAAVADPVIQRVGEAILPAFRRTGAASGLFLDHMLHALAAHVVHRYGGVARRPGPAGLAPWQMARAKELMRARLDEKLAISDLAAACGLSVSHFARAFRATTGLAPHQWLLRRRVERAQTLMAEGGAPLSQVGLACGFADQSHFTRVFRRAVGVSPASWRKARGSS